MKYLNLLLTFLLLCMLGCSGDSLLGVQVDDQAADTETVAAAKKTVKMVPFKGTLAGPGSIDLTRTDCPGGTVPVRGEGSGQATHVGRFDATFSHCSFFFLDPTNPHYVDGRATIIAANGDEIHATYYGYVTGPDTFVDFATITGGTGRFENARGSYVEYGTFVLTAEGFDYEISFEGEISSVGSSK